DLIWREIPLPLTLTGTVVGLIGAILLPWPWPWPVEQALPHGRPGVPPGMVWQDPESGLKAGAYPWPVWGPLPDWLSYGSWQLGLATGVAGLLVGTWMMRGVAFLFSRGLGRE